ncbi:MAG: response regulator [Chitinophagaceae bacterium]|nr:response regulator [Chitinophagaceae bacterium]
MLSKEQYVLMLEDDADDRYITETTIKELGYDFSIRFLTYGRELMSYLTQAEEPSLILLDYNPVTGADTLRQLKTHPDFNHIPVVVLSELVSPNHVRQCYQLGANSFIMKPHSADLTRNKIETFFKYWFEVAEI